MSIQLTTSQLRGLKGSPLSVLMAMIMVGQPVGAEWLERTTGYTDKSVLSSLLFLEEAGYIQRNGRYAWVITGDQVQLPLMVTRRPLMESPSEEEDPMPAGEIASSQSLLAMTGIEEGETRNNSDSEFPTPAPSSSSRVFNLDSSKENLLLASNADPEKFRVDANLAELAAQGIREPARTRLARLAGVTPELIRAHCASCPGKIGQAIYRIEHNWPLPVSSLQPTLPQPARSYWPEDEPDDEQACTWWDQICDALRAVVPRAELEAWLGQDLFWARRKDGALEVLAESPWCFERYLAQAQLDGLVQEITSNNLKQLRIIARTELGNYVKR